MDRPDKMSPTMRRILNRSGTGLSLVGIGFVVVRLHSYWLDLDLSLVTPLAWGAIALLSVIYGLANLPRAFAWWNLVQYLGASPSWLGSTKIYGISQLAKYVPGNVFHLAVRQALGMAAGISAGVLAKSTVLELGLVAVAGALFGWVALPLWLPSFSVGAGVLVMTVSTGLITALLYRVAGYKTMLAFFLQMLSLLISSIVFVALLELICRREAMGLRYWLTIGGAYTVGWLVGLVTPGAPAGAGIREVILLFFLDGVIPKEELLMAVLLGRLVTVGGDLLFFATTSLIPPQSFTVTEREHA